MNAAVHCNAKVDFVDIDIDTFNISIDLLTKKLEIAKLNNTLPKVITPVHLGGSSPEMKKIYQLSKKYKFKILEDASHSIGGNYMKLPIGCCKFSDICIFSFHPVKIITTGEGGMLLTNNKKIFNRALSHSIIKNNNKNRFKKSNLELQTN